MMGGFISTLCPTLYETYTQLGDGTHSLQSDNGATRRSQETRGPRALVETMIFDYHIDNRVLMISSWYD